MTDNACIVIGRKGAAGAVHLSRIPCWPIDTTYYVTPPAELSLEYIYYALGFLDLASLDKSTAIPGLNRDDLYSQTLPLPPLPEQHRIVAEIEKQLTRLDAGLAALRRAGANVRRYKAAVLKAACEGRLVPQDAADEPASLLLERILAERRARWEAEQIAKGKDPKKLKYKEPAAPDREGLPELAEGWVWAAVEQLGEVRLGRQRSPRHHSGEFMRPYLRAANATWDGVDLSDVKEMNFPPEIFETYRLQKDDILVAEASGSASEVGKPFIWQEQIPDCCFQNTLIRVRLMDLPPQYLYLHFLKDAITGRFGEVAKGVGIHHLGAERLAMLPVTVPPLDEQQRIVAEVERRLSVVEGLEASIEANLKRAERLRQAVLKRAFAGELVPQDPSDEPADVLLERIRVEREKRG